MSGAGYWPSAWPGEDGGPLRRQIAPGALGTRDGGSLRATSRLAPITTMAVLRDAGEVFLLRHSGGEGAFALVERIDPVSLEPLATSVELAAGPVWPGGVAVHANGDLYVIFGNHAHRLSPGLDVVTSCTLPRVAPYNSFVLAPDGHLITKDFAGSLPDHPVAAAERRPSELLALEPERLEIVDRLELPEASIARLSADDDDIYVVGDASLLRVVWDGARLTLDDRFSARYVCEGGGYGWDCVLAGGHAWFLDNGEGSERYDGSLIGHGVAAAPLHLVRVDLASGAVDRAEICGRSNGLVANPPVVDVDRNVAVGYDSGNGVISAFDTATLTRRWTRTQNHASHLVLFAESGELVTADFDPVRSTEQLVVLDLQTGDELARVDTESPVQSVLFPAPGFDHDVYVCSFTTITRVFARS